MSRISALRAIMVEVAASLAVAGVWTGVRGPLASGRALLVGGGGGVEFDRALVDLCAATLLGCALWGWLATTAVVTEVLRGGSGAAGVRGVPAPVRRLVLATCGVALVTAGAATALAADPAHHPHAASVLDGLPLPDRAMGGMHHHHRPHPAPRRRTVVVRPGDTLWGLAAAELPPSAGDASIVARWRALYAANQAVIGPDPDLIEPGQTLHLPERT